MSSRARPSAACRLHIKYPSARQLSKEFVPFRVPDKWLSEMQAQCQHVVTDRDEVESAEPSNIPQEFLTLIETIGDTVIPFANPEAFSSVWNQMPLPCARSKRIRLPSASQRQRATESRNPKLAVVDVRKRKLLKTRRKSTVRKRSVPVPYDGPKFKYIEKNVYINVPVPCADSDEDLPHCDCRANRRDCSDDECINRMLMVCCPSSCPAAPDCKNMFPIEDGPIEQFKTNNRGWGLRAKQPIACNQFVTEYRGEIINSAECERRQRANLEKGIWDTYLLGLESDLYIDARHMSGLGRFLNHSCDPNTIAQKWQDGPHPRIAVIAKRNIEKGEEVTLDYSFSDPRNQFRHVCLCGSKNCRGYIDSDKPIDWEAEKIRKALSYDYCFECGEGGDLLTCSFSHREFNCHRAFHAQCIGLRLRPPPGTWFMCPSHTCDVCKKVPPQVQCLSCVSTWCQRHSPFPIQCQNDGVSKSRPAQIIYRICPRCVRDGAHSYLSSSTCRPLIKSLPQSRSPEHLSPLGTGECLPFSLDLLDTIQVLEGI